VQGTPPASPSARTKFAPPHLLWKTFLRRCDSMPAPVEDVVYTGAGSYLYQLDADGRTLWATETGNQQSSPVFDDRQVYVGGDRGVLHALDRRTGKVAWRFQPGGTNTFLTAPAVGGGRVFAEGTDDTVYAVEARGGVLRWKFTRPDGSLGYAAPVWTRGRVFVCGESTLYALGPGDGHERWRARAGGKSLATPAVAGRRVFVGGDGSGLSAFAEHTGAPLWSFVGDAPGDWFGPPCYAAGTVFVTTYKRYVYAVDAVSGRKKWAARLLGPGLATPAFDAARGVVYVTSQTFRNNPTLWAFDARGGRPLWDFRAGSINKGPAVLGGRLYVGSLDGYFYAFRLGASDSAVVKPMLPAR
jgi:outer membrane protein assembly factor BamB